MKTFSRCLLLSVALASSFAFSNSAFSNSAFSKIEPRSIVSDFPERDVLDKTFSPRGLQNSLPPSAQKALSPVLGSPYLLSHRGGNGGNSIASEFTGVANNLAKAWEALCGESLLNICSNLDSFKSLLERNHSSFVTVLSNPAVAAYDGEVREAVNFERADGKHYIMVGEDSWKNIETSYYEKNERKINLVLHEYFSILGLESSDYYEKSRELYDFLERADYDMEKIADERKLPSPCSISVDSNGSLGERKTREIKTKLKQEGYKHTEGIARFKLTASKNCDDSVFLPTCSVYIEISDTFKNGSPAVFDAHRSSRNFSMSSSLNIALAKAFDDMPQCSPISGN